MTDCEYRGIHDDERSAEVRVGWLCADDHVLAINYCSECYTYVSAPWYLKNLACNPQGYEGSPKCTAHSKILEAVTLKVKT